MEYSTNYYGSVPSSLLQAYSELLSKTGLKDEHDTDGTVLLTDCNCGILACGSKKGNILKQIAVAPKAESQGLCALVVSELVRICAEEGMVHLFLFTKPSHRSMFSSLGFYPIGQSSDMLMMENRCDGMSRFLSALPRYPKRVGCVVCKCNPFTLGHRYLFEAAARDCDRLLAFVLSDDRGMFSAKERMSLVRAGTSDLKNVDILSGGDYLISPDTFPTYFIKDDSRCREAQCELDITLFTEIIAPALNISVRYVGSEPFDPITAQYNDKMAMHLPRRGIELKIIPRYRDISAGKVRKLICDGRTAETKDLLPETTYEYCRNRFE